MTSEPIPPDPALGEALKDVAGDALNQPVEWAAMGAAIRARAAHDLKRRRQRRLRNRFVIPGTLAAGIALLFVISRPLPWAEAPAPESRAGGITIDELLDADVTDDQFRSLLSGAGDANDLLLIAAGDTAADEASPANGERP